MLSILLLTGTAFPCAALLTNDEGAIATSDAQEVILEDREEGVRTHYRVRYDGDADSLAGSSWFTVRSGKAMWASRTKTSLTNCVIGPSRERPAIPLEEAMAPFYRCKWLQLLGGFRQGQWFWRRVFSWRYRFVGWSRGHRRRVCWAIRLPSLDPSDGEALTDWLSTEGFVLGETAGTVAEYVMEGGYSFVAVTLTPDEGKPRARDGRCHRSISIRTRTPFSFQRMSLTGMAEEQAHDRLGVGR